MSEYLFPHRLSRRDFLWTAAGATAILSSRAGAADAKLPVKFGAGKYTYTLDESWGKLPQGMQWLWLCRRH